MSNLPGSRMKYIGSETCEECNTETRASWRLTGECDSFGCEYVFLCNDHMTKHDEAAKVANTSGTCDWCKTHQPDLSPHRDFEEGSNGPVYDICLACIQKESAALEEELSTSHERDEDWDFPDHVEDDEEEEEEEVLCPWPAGSEFKATYRSKCWPEGYGDMFTKYFANAAELEVWELDQARWARLEGNAIQGTVWRWDALRGDECEHSQL
jgi:hypothetical protein